jgi:hypothetical protein
MAGLAVWLKIDLLQGDAEKSAFHSEPALLYSAVVRKRNSWRRFCSHKSFRV